MPATRYSIVIPAYNEERRIGATLERVLAYVERPDWDVEILVVNDGSRDRTVEIVRGFAARNPRLQLLENPGNRGKGYSVRHGMLRATGEVLLFTDADMSSPIEEAHKLFDAITGGADVAIGSRWLRSELQTQRQSVGRQLLGRAFNLVPRIVLGLNYRDTQCGFKAFTRQAALKIFPRQRIERWGFDPELLFLAGKFQFKVAEIAVSWAHSEGTRIQPLRDGAQMVWEVCKIRWYGWTGKYDANSQISAPETRADL